MASSLTPENPSIHITEYEQQRNSRKKALHDAVERTLLAAGLSDAAVLRSLFSGEASCTGGDAETPTAPRKQRNKSARVQADVSIPRTRRITKQAQEYELKATAEIEARKKSQEHFCTWPGRGLNNITNKGMKKTKGGLKRKKMESPDPDLDSAEEECVPRSPSTQVPKNQCASASEERRPAVFEDDIEEIAKPERPKEIEGLPRPGAAGYRSQHQERRLAQEWGDDGRHSYGQTSGGPYRNSFARPWSPNPYAGGREYEGRASDYGGRGVPYEGRRDYQDRRDSYYDGRGRDFDRRGREYEDLRRQEDLRYNRRAPLPSDMYAHTPDALGGNYYARSSRRPSSPPPSSSAILENEVAADMKARRPLQLDKSGVPIGKMASLFHGDIVLFAKDMDPTVGWEGQSKDAKERLLQRLMHDYEIYGESSKLSKKYLRKEAGAALIQYRFTVNQYIDRGCPKPGDLRQEYWDALKKRRESTEAKAKSAKMATIARGRGLKNTTKKTLEQSVLVKLTLELKREPYNSELQEAVDKEWAIIQEEAAEKKKMRAAANASNAASEATKDLEKQLQLLEAFVEKWQPDFELWKKMKHGVKELEFLDCSNDRGKELAILPVPEKEVCTKEVEEGKTSDSGDDDSSSEKSKTSGEEDNDSEKEVNDSDVEKTHRTSEHPTSVVEPEQTPPKCPVKKTNAGISSVPLPKSNPVTTVVPPLIHPVARSNVDLEPEAKRGKVLASVEGMGTGKQGRGTEAEKGRETHSESAKRLKLASKSPEEVVVLDEEPADEKVQSRGGVAKSTKSNRKTGKASQVKVDSKGGRVKASCAGEILLLENSEPRKFLGTGSIVHSDFDRDRVPMPRREAFQLVRLILKTVTSLDAPLPYLDVDRNGKVECTTLGEAFRKRCAVWWPAPPGL